VAASGQLSWPPPGRFVTVYGQDLVAADRGSPVFAMARAILWQPTPGELPVSGVGRALPGFRETKGGLQCTAHPRPPGDVDSRLVTSRVLHEAQTGKPDWGAIFEVVWAPMVRAARSAMLTMGVDDRLAVEDAVVAGFERLQSKGLQNTTNLIGWARTMAYRAGQDAARAIVLHRRRNPDQLDEEMVDPDPGPEELLISTLAEEQRQIELERRYQAAMACLETLPPGQRQAVVEVVMNGKSDSQLAQQLGVSHTAVWKRRMKALHRLLECTEAKLAAQAEIHDGDVS